MTERRDFTAKTPACSRQAKKKELTTPEGMPTAQDAKARRDTESKDIPEEAEIVIEEWLCSAGHFVFSLEVKC
jgi:hypothetical protein